MARTQELGTVGAVELDLQEQAVMEKAIHQPQDQTLDGKAQGKPLQSCRQQVQDQCSTHRRAGGHARSLRIRSKGQGRVKCRSALPSNHPG